jgi:hypothetical protein
MNNYFNGYLCNGFLTNLFEWGEGREGQDIRPSPREEAKRGHLLRNLGESPLSTLIQRFHDYLPRNRFQVLMSLWWRYSLFPLKFHIKKEFELTRTPLPAKPLDI